MKRPNLSEVESFLAVVDRRGFGAAARELGVTQSTVSRRIAALEQRIGRRLVERTTRRVVLTETGLAYADELRDVLMRLENAEARVQARPAEPEGLLRITMPTAYGRVCVLPRLAGLAERYPRLRFELDLSDRYVDLLDSGFDVAVRLAAPAQSGIDTEKIGSFGLHLCASPGYLTRRGPVSDPQNLAAHDCLALRTYAPRVDWRMTWQDRAVNIEITPRMTVSDMTALRELTLAGAGVAVLPSYVASADFAAGRLVDVLPGLVLPSIDVFVAYPRHRSDLSKVAVLLDELRS